MSPIFGVKRRTHFLYTSLSDNKVNPHDLEFLDFGAGSGYFVSALKKVGLTNVVGTEVSKYQVDFANGMIGEEALQVHEIENSICIAKKIFIKNCRKKVLG